MSQVAELLKEASHLDRSDQVELVISLLENLEAHPHEVSDEEARARLAELKSGEVKG